MMLKAINPRIKVLIFHNLRGRTGMIQMSRRNRSTINKWRFHMGKDGGAILTTRRRRFSLVDSPLSELASVTLLVGSPTFNGAVDSLSPSMNLLNMLSTLVVMEVLNVSKATLNSS